MYRKLLVSCCVALSVLAPADVVSADDTGQLPGWWPAEVPVVEGAEITKVKHAETSGLPSVRFKVALEDRTPESLIELYRKSLGADGWVLSEERDTGMARSVTATKTSIDKRVIVTVKKPGTIFNKHRDAYLLEIIVYRSIPAS